MNQKVLAFQIPLEHISGTGSRLPDKEPFLRQILDHLTLAVKLVFRRSHDHKFPSVVNEKIVFLFLKKALHHCKFDLPLVKAPQQILGVGHHHFHRNIRLGVHKPHQCFRENVLSHSHGRPEHETTPAAIRHLERLL